MCIHRGQSVWTWGHVPFIVPPLPRVRIAVSPFVDTAAVAHLIAPFAFIALAILKPVLVLVLVIFWLRLACGYYSVIDRQTGRQTDRQAGKQHNLELESDLNMLDVSVIAAPSCHTPS